MEGRREERRDGWGDGWMDGLKDGWSVLLNRVLQGPPNLRLQEARKK